jgi:transcriptional regulator GlxA family with amidase domain
MVIDCCSRVFADLKLLRDSNLAITQVAERCGYGHVSTFSATFNEQFKSRRTMRAALGAGTT